MWIDVRYSLPKIEGVYAVFGRWNIGSEYEARSRGTARWNGDYWVDDRHGEDLVGLDKSIQYWWSFRDIKDPEAYA